jgi:putative hydrolase of the HAD superfamily
VKPAVLFDLGNTLAAYYRADEFGPILEQIVGDLHRTLTERGLTAVSGEAALASAIAENREAPDHRFMPMAERLERIFGVPLAHDADLADTLCRTFLGPIFALGRLYADTLPVLAQLRQAGHPIGVVSNTPWGSPPELWRDELMRLGLSAEVDALVFCGDAGWRKPAPEIFERAAAAVDRRIGDCVFVGDDLRWDVAGSRSVGMRPILIDRDGRHRNHDENRIEDLFGVFPLLER